MAFPYGASLNAFLENYDRSEQQNLARRGVELREALTLRQLTDLDRKQKEEEQVMADLAAEVGASRGKIAPSGIQILPGQAALPAVTAGGADIGEPGEAVLQPSVAAMPPQRTAVTHSATSSAANRPKRWASRP